MTHLFMVLLLTGVALVLYAICELIAWGCAYLRELSASDHWAMFCYCFVLAWWLIYFMSPRLKLPTLRLFLRRYSVLRQEQEQKIVPAPNYESMSDAMNTKCASTIEAQGIYMAVISLLLVYVVDIQDPTPFQTVLVRVAVLAALVAILLLVISSDMLDTASNRFLVHQDEKSWTTKRLFYRGINPPGVHGGYAYYAYALLTFFLIVSISLIWPPLSGVAVATLGYFGYPYWFGYKHVLQSGKAAEQGMPEGLDILHDPCPWPSIVIALVFLVGTILATAVLS